jgi:hypothetical protein
MYLHRNKTNVHAPSPLPVKSLWVLTLPSIMFAFYPSFCRKDTHKNLHSRRLLSVSGGFAFLLHYHYRRTHTRNMHCVDNKNLFYVKKTARNFATPNCFCQCTFNRRQAMKQFSVKHNLKRHLNFLQFRITFYFWTICEVLLFTFNFFKSGSSSLYHRS